jgi:hypothetical protein
MVKIIFRTYPAVKQKYLQVCPAELSEKDFWTQFFQSQYFHRDRMGNSKKVFCQKLEKNVTEKFQDAQIFQNCDEVEAKETKKFETNAIVNMEEVFDMDYLNDFPEIISKERIEQERQKTKDKKHKAAIHHRETSKTLIRRFNQHSSLVLRSCQK